MRKIKQIIAVATIGAGLVLASSCYADQCPAVTAVVNNGQWSLPSGWVTILKSGSPGASPKMNWVTLQAYGINNVRYAILNFKLI